MEKTAELIESLATVITVQEIELSSDDDDDSDVDNNVV